MTNLGQLKSGESHVHIILYLLQSIEKLSFMDQHDTDTNNVISENKTHLEEFDKLMNSHNDFNDHSADD